jgi:hypothetical protein
MLSGGSDKTRAFRQRPQPGAASGPSEGLQPIPAPWIFPAQPRNSADSQNLGSGVEPEGAKAPGGSVTSQLVGLSGDAVGHGVLGIGRQRSQSARRAAASDPRSGRAENRPCREADLHLNC